MDKAIKRANASLDKLVSKITSSGPQETQYALIANRAGVYPDVRNGTTTLQAGDVWKYGTTANPGSRYSGSALRALNVTQVTQYRGTRSQTLVVEKLKLINHALKNGSLPPGNKIFK
jgi:hypothetical protein